MAKAIQGINGKKTDLDFILWSSKLRLPSPILFLTLIFLFIRILYDLQTCHFSQAAGVFPSQSLY